MNALDFWKFFLFSFLDFFVFLEFLSKLLWLLIKVTKVTTGHQKLPKMSQNSIICSFFARRAKNASAGARSRPAWRAVSSSDVNNVNFILGAHSRKFLQHKERFKDSSAEVSVFWLFIDLGY